LASDNPPAKDDAILRQPVLDLRALLRARFSV
jgi:hypothetical protein